MAAQNPSKKATKRVASENNQMNRKDTASEEEIKLLICILRLRCQRPIPYPQIESYLNETLGLPDEVLPEIFDREEREETKIWEDAKAWDDWKVERILIISGLNKEGYKLAERREIDAQIEWRKTGNWKAGSVPLELDEVTRVNVVAGIIGSVGTRRASRGLKTDILRPLQPDSHAGILRYN
jgi:hypothetical protein